ncbi:hypothetical protein LWI28_027796 [Acer negundo]|uniref:Cytochrome P450 n=1 Tax=Acer negundo TaxID=4023 RepID=A0AAD5P810_ACENE|nr:hypothetical protein LWI28_027796 [Acer negundo]
MVTETFRLGGASNIVDFLPVLKWVGFGGVEKRLMVLGKKRDRFMQDLIEEHRTKMESDKSEDCLLDGDRKKISMIEVLLSFQVSEPQCYSDEIICILMILPPLCSVRLFSAASSPPLCSAILLLLLS